METTQRVALITGANSGIGRQLVLEYVARGWKVAGLARRQSELEDLAKALGDRASAFIWKTADITNAQSLADAVADFESRLGPIDLLIASAGVAGDTPATSIDANAIAHILNINLIGTSNTIAAVLPGMLSRRRGHIVALSSLASFRGLPKQMGYCASKAGLNAMMESLRLDVKDHGIHVSTICPGYIRSPQAVGMYKDEVLMPVEDAAREILWAIDRKKTFHAFPRSTAMQLRWMRLLPAWLQDRLLVSSMEKARVQKESAD